MASRAFTRVPIHVVAALRPPGAVEVRGRIRDLSLNGFSIDTDVDIAVGTPCGVSILLETGTEPIPVEGSGTVIRSGDGGVALKLDAIDPDGFDHLVKLVLYNSPDAAAIEEEAGDGADLRDLVRKDDRR